MQIKTCLHILYEGCAVKAVIGDIWNYCL